MRSGRFSDSLLRTMIWRRSIPLTKEANGLLLLRKNRSSQTAWRTVAQATIRDWTQTVRPPAERNSRFRVIFLRFFASNGRK